MSERIQPHKVPMWEFFDEHPGASSPVDLGSIESLGQDYRRVTELFVNALEGRRRVLDLGCGTGMPGLYLARHVGEVVGVDAAPNMVAAARRNAETMGLANVRLTVAGTDRLPFDAGEFDGVSMLGLLGSMDWACVHHAMDEVNRVLGAGGTVTVLEEDWRRVVEAGPQRAANIRASNRGPVLQVVERSVQPMLERDTRYLLAAGSPTGRRLMEELGQAERVATAVQPPELDTQDIVDAWYDEGARFDEATLAYLARSRGLREAEVRKLDIWEGVLFLTAAGTACPR